MCVQSNGKPATRTKKKNNKISGKIKVNGFNDYYYLLLLLRVKYLYCVVQVVTILFSQQTINLLIIVHDQMHCADLYAWLNVISSFMN